ncbi:hypothetical protein AXA44_18810 [Rhodococcus sp. SC4]|uniref:PucR family transcriptional regulator n=1 Tax=Rhodococcus sp. LB1 TaxID=1807499 RepID=UPI00077A9104|nr:helix-turn-helix domain-containing protein [Rhodococcus sp. LB1]KXF50621.1 hypothetical protein AXA44_18810 [Rhodococcus sp. SC4]KXX58333.1 hypothetical protein AZG88_00435 [Rhodococcus sp. LB1]
MTNRQDTQRWHGLVSRQSENLGTLVEQFMNRLLDAGEYRDAGLREAELRATSSDVFALMLRALVDPTQVGVVERLASRLGRRRARDGIPLDSMLTAIRLDFPILWSGLLSTAGRSEAHVLAAHAEEVWNVVDTFARFAQAAYLAEQDQLTRERQDLQRQQISLLFDAVGQFEVNHVQIARALGVSVSSFYRVVAVPSESAVTLRHNIDRAHFSERVFTHEQGRHLIAFWQIPSTSPMVVTPRELALLDKVRAAVAPIARAIADIPLAALAASRMVDQLGPDEERVTDLKASWPMLAKKYLAEIGCDLGQYVLVPLREATERENERLLETMVAYLHTGSLLGTAATIYCHRNTVLNRLHRIEELTGLDITKPADAALAMVALAAQQN